MTAAWWPKGIDTDMIPAIRSLGKRGIKIKECTQLVNNLAQVELSFDDTRPFTLAEKKVRQSVAAMMWTPLAVILAGGPKLFIIPPDMIDDLNQIEIPLLVKDYSQPFPAVIVKSGDEYHFCYQYGERLMVVTHIAEINKLDVVNFFVPNVPIETNLGDVCWEHFDIGEPGQQQKHAMVPIESNFDQVHRFRATLNFLLLLMAGGFTEERQRTRTHKQKHRPGKYAEPKIFKSQNINLWRKRLIDANHPTGEGSHKRAHWRRAHWRRVAVGVGRVGRELRLMPAVLVNKDKLKIDPANSEYVCQ